MIFCYSFFTFFFYPILVLIIYFRKLINKEDQNRYKEKIFFSSLSPKRKSGSKLVWFHAASIGEVQSIFPIITRLNKTKRNLEFLITTVTLSAGDLVEKKFGKNHNIHHRYFPIDVKFLIKKFLDVWKPNLILFVDSEIWPNLILEIKKQKISSIIINGRITKKSFDRWMLVSRFAKKIFNTFDLCLASSNESKKYLKKLNAKNIKHIGNIKLSTSVDLNKIKNQNENIFNKKRVWCAASTHEGEEFLCLRAHINLKKVYRNLLTVIIPRHINRTNDISKLCAGLDLNFQVLTSTTFIKKDKEVIIVNSFGALQQYFKYSKSVFIGKSTLSRFKQVGGQSPIEAAKLGCKIYHGPYVYNFKEIYKLFKSYKICKKIKSGKDLTKKLMIDLKSPKSNHHITNNKINNLGKRILNNTTKEINKFL